MTVEEFLESVELKVDAMIAWFSDGFNLLLDFDFMSMTLGQAGFTAMLLCLAFLGGK